jgi:hypothetical protein
MDHHVKEYYRQSSDETPRGHFHAVIPLHEAPDITWKAITEKVPDLNRGWFELAHLSTKDRIEFTRDFWLTKLSYRPGFDEFLSRFFASLDDIGIFITQKKFEDPFEANLVYSIKGNSGFFRGNPPISEKNLEALKRYFSEYMLPQDYLIFLQIHDGFCKTTDTTGLTKSTQMPESYENFQKLIQKHEPMVTSKGRTVNPNTLIPFYESFGMPFFQCFWAEWYPEQEMGNVYYSGQAKTISDVDSNVSSTEIMAFPTFIDWLVFYLERVE